MLGFRFFACLLLDEPSGTDIVANVSDTSNLYVGGFIKWKLLWNGQPRDSRLSLLKLVMISRELVSLILLSATA